MRQLRLAVAVLVAAALVLTLVPAVASAEDGRNVTAQATTYPADDWDLGAGDPTPSTATLITPGDYGQVLRQERALHTVDGASGDNDWVKFTVTSDDVNLDRTSFLFRTTSTMNNVDTVIEVYGPYATSSFSYTVGYNSGAADPLALAANDEDPWRGETNYTHDSALLFRPPAAGTYYVRIRPYSASGSYVGQAGSYTLLVKKGLLQRVSGSDRIQTAVEVSEFMYEAGTGPGTRNMAVVIASAYNFPDALAGSILCGISDGPMLLTNPGYLPTSVGEEILRLGVDRVYVVGGTAAISDDVVTDLQNLSPGDIGVYRVAGDDRFMTATEIALQAQSDDAGYSESISHLAVVAYGLNFPDALAASALSAGRNVPILLTRSSSLNSDSEEALYHLGITDVVIVGGTSVVSTTVENQLIAILGSTHVYRVAGDNRYETAKEFAAWASDLKGPGARNDSGVGTPGATTIVGKLSANRFGIASGENFPDALAGGAACGLSNHPLLLNRKSTPYGYITSEYDGWLPAGDTDWVSDYHTVYPVSTFWDGVVFGGTAAITESTMATLDNSIMLIGAP